MPSSALVYTPGSLDASLAAKGVAGGRTGYMAAGRGSVDRVLGVVAGAIVADGSICGTAVGATTVAVALGMDVAVGAGVGAVQLARIMIRIKILLRSRVRITHSSFACGVRRSRRR